MFCPHCGQAVADGATFCGACGKPLIEGVTREVDGYHAGMALAGVWPRVGALLLDLAVLVFATSIVWEVIVGTAAVVDSMRGVPSGEVGGWGRVVALVPLVLPISLFWYYQGRGGSPGLSALGLRIVDATGGPPGRWRGLARLVVATFLSVSLFSLGYLWALWDREKRTWHDHLAGTWVVVARTSEEPPEVASGEPPVEPGEQ